MSKINDKVHLAKKYEHWSIDQAEKLLASPSPWGPAAYAFGFGYIDDAKRPDQADDFLALAQCIDGAYKRHGKSIGEAWNWANPIIHNVKEGGSYTEYTTQELLDIVFLYARGEHFNDGLIRSEEPTLREIMREVVRRIHSSAPPLFLTQK